MSAGAGRVLARYRGLDLGPRAYGFIRWSVSPFDRVLSHVPEGGRLLDLGCGSGLWLTYLSLERPGLKLVGVDPDPRKLEIAQSADARDLELHRGSALDIPGADFDCITIFDVLYLLPAEEKRSVLQACRDALRPGGSLLVKELDVRPRWKFWPAAAEEFFAVRLANLTLGDKLHFQSVQDLARDVSDTGFVDVVDERVDRGYLHPHVLVRSTRSN